ncbi:hypothetical protein LSH36_2917g00000 [Paralvinella palmiformis]|uniref:Uncharacterized protein n=1 Tax=Paralvinella palmiformis TaxID=53620 RepID=A0AAD9MPS7_9ANNE|nr:hypothetical protein LSH36_2917g00000 [Paralvinella palmiformis]
MMMATRSKRAGPGACGRSTPFVRWVGRPGAARCDREAQRTTRRGRPTSSWNVGGQSERRLSSPDWPVVFFLCVRIMCVGGTERARARVRLSPSVSVAPSKGRPQLVSTTLSGGSLGS